MVQSLAAEQVRAGHDVYVAAVLDEGAGEHPLMPALRTRGVHVHALYVPPRAYRHERRVVRQICADLRPDIVHTHGYRTDVLHGPVARRLGIPVVSTAHGFCGGDWKNRIYEHLQRRALRRSAAAVAVSRPMYAGLLEWGIPDTTLHCIPNAWADPPEFLDRNEARRTLGLDADGWYAGFVGRIGQEKGPDVFVDALEAAAHASSADSGPQIRGVLIGEGHLRAGLAARTADPAFAAPVTWTGAVENAGRLIRAFDAVVLSSRTEGTPMVLLEAMAAGVPVIATTVGGMPDVLRDDAGVLVPPEDPAALGAALRSVAADAGEAQRRAARAQDRIETEFGADAWRERYDTVYRMCIETAAA